MPLPGETNSDAWRALASRLSRIITPALVQTSTFCTESTRVVISHQLGSVTDTVSPVDVYAYWNASAVPQMSAPLPFTVKTPPLKDALPAAPTLPMSACDQPLGS